MVVLQGYWFDGKTSARISAEVQVDDTGKLRAVHLADNTVFQSCDFSDIRISSRLGNTPRYLYFAGGEKFETFDNDVIDQLLHQYRPSFLNTLVHQLESHIYFVGVTLIVVVALSWVGVKYGLPATSKTIAYHLPQHVMDLASKETLTLLDKTHLEPTNLEQSVQDRVLTHFAPALKENANLDVRVLFRNGGDLGANAFALPDGTIIFTDDMVRLAKDDNELLAVLAHEIGHVKYRHALRSAIQGTSIGFLVSMLTGDLSAASSALAALPVILTTMSYSRDFEREADQNALDYLHAHKIDTMNFVTLMERVTYEAHCNMLLRKDHKWDDIFKNDADEDHSKNEKNQDDISDKQQKNDKHATEQPILTDEQLAARKVQCDKLIEEHKSDKSAVMDYFSTHPATEERLQKFREVN